jgi:hypothetical protein
MHGKNPSKVAEIYRFTDNGILVSSTSMAYSIGDTEIIINLYFDSEKLVKAKTVSFDLNNNRNEYNYYYHDNQLINKDIEMKGIHGSKHYLDLANIIRRNLKKRPIKFPLD